MKTGVPKIAALVPMRHDSERVPGKNFRLFGGRPLYHYIVETLLSCSRISMVIIDTDSPVIMEDAAANFPSVRVIERPEHIRGGMVPMNDVLKYDVSQVNADFYLQTHSTNPLLTRDSIERALDLFLSHQEDYDSLFSVRKLQTRLWDVKGKPVNHNPELLQRTQDLTPLFEENSCMYIFNRETLELMGNRIGKRPLLFEMDSFESFDIDTEEDFSLAEKLYQESK